MLASDTRSLLSRTTSGDDLLADRTLAMRELGSASGHSFGAVAAERHVATDASASLRRCSGRNLSRNVSPTRQI